MSRPNPPPPWDSGQAATPFLFVPQKAFREFSMPFLTPAPLPTVFPPPKMPSSLPWTLVCKLSPCAHPTPATPSLGM